jgi:hypothetical protein
MGYVVAERFTARLTCLSYRPVTNVCAGCGLHRIKGIFGAGHAPVVSSGHSGFLHHQNGKKS